MMQPQAHKYRKQQKGPTAAWRRTATRSSFGEFGLKSTERVPSPRARSRPPAGSSRATSSAAASCGSAFSRTVR